MDNSLYLKLDSKISEDQIPKTQGSKKRKISEETDLLKKKISEKTVVRVKIEENENDKQKSEGPPPSDCWSWRKYGQKPIKGSPYPRGYYRCSSSKGCSAKKQVERCRTDASFFIITYTCTHDHSSAKEPKQETPKIPKEEDLKEKDEKGQESLNGASENITDFHYSQSPFNSPSHQDIIIDLKQEEESPFTENLQNVLFDEVEKPRCYSNPLTFSTPKSEENDLYDFSTPKSDENDFYDELGELPMSSSSSFMRSNFVEDRIIILPS